MSFSHVSFESVKVVIGARMRKLDEYDLRCVKLVKLDSQVNKPGLPRIFGVNKGVNNGVNTVDRKKAGRETPGLLFPCLPGDFSNSDQMKRRKNAKILANA